MGAAYAAGLAIGLFDDLDQIASLWHENHRWEPDMDQAERSRLVAGWAKAVERTFGWIGEDG